MNDDARLNFYNTTLKQLWESGKEFHFEIPKNYFTKETALEFLSNCYDYYYTNDGIHEKISIRHSPTIVEIMYFTLTSSTNQVISGKEYSTDFLVRLNSMRELHFPHYWWNILFEYALVKDGKFKDSIHYM